MEDSSVVRKRKIPPPVPPKRTRIPRMVPFQKADDHQMSGLNLVAPDIAVQTNSALSTEPIADSTFDAFSGIASSLPRTVLGPADGSSESAPEIPASEFTDGAALLNQSRDSNNEGAFGDELETRGINDKEPLLADDEDSSSDETAQFVHPLSVATHGPDDESSWMILFQVAFPFLIAGCGMVGAGLVLDMVQHWRVFTEVPEIFILVPALLGLKGNLEMTLASRLSTLANLGKMDSRHEQIKQVYSNLALIQAQAVVVAFLASAFAVALAWVPQGKVDWHHAMLLGASSLTTASLASLILGLIMVGVVLLSRHYNINPDNVATPIAASLGDLTTLGVLAFFSTIFLRSKDATSWLNPIVVFVFVVTTPLWMYIASRNPSTNHVLKHGWTPVIFAMLISSAGGFILKFAVMRFHGIAVFQPVMNGIGGNLVAVQASRLSTSLHRTGKPGHVPRGGLVACFNPLSIFFGDTVIARAARVLLLMVVPGHLIFMYMIHFLQAGHTTITLMFAIVYLTSALIQVGILLYICVGMVHKMWMRGVDPDNSAIPYLTALGDLLGTGLLAVAFLLLYAIGDRDADIGE